MCWSILLSPLLLITFKELIIFKNHHFGCFTRCVRLISLYVLMKCQSLQNWNGTWNFELISTRKIIWNYEKLDVQIQHKFNIFLNYISNVILDIGNWRDNWSPRNPLCWICFFFIASESDHGLALSTHKLLGGLTGVTDKDTPLQELMILFLRLHFFESVGDRCKLFIGSSVKTAFSQFTFSHIETILVTAGI